MDAAAKQITETTKTVETYTVLNSSNSGVTLNTGWVVVDHDVTINGNITIQDQVNLLLCDGATLTCKSLVNVNSLIRIYGQANDSGTIIAASDTEDAAGIGSYSENYGCGPILIFGGTVKANGGKNGAGIGTANCGKTGYVTIYGGKITATGGACAAGIGGGNEGKLTGISIYGGSITASSTEDGAGIGSGEDNGDVGSIRIYGAKAQAQFRRDEEHPADAKLTSEDSASPYYYDPAAVTADMIDTGASDMTAGLPEGVTYAGTTIVYLSETSLRHYYQGDLTNVTAVFNGRSAGPVKKDDAFCYELKNIAAAELDTLFILSINGTEYKYSALDYVKACLSSDSVSDEMKALAAATYRYNQAANEYFGK